MKHKGIGLAALLLGLLGGLHAEPVGWLGIYQQELNGPMQTALGVTHGVLVTEIVDNSPAVQAGLKVGDVVLRVDSQDIFTVEELRHFISGRPSQAVTVEYLRQGIKDTLVVQLGTRERQLDFSLDELPPLTAAAEQIRPVVKSVTEQYLAEVRALREEIASLQKEIARLRKDLKKIEK
jgi:membrane-associated protease RseP (regulator of RpoE activity)